jgi:lysophospholipase L1-like esterase
MQTLWNSEIEERTAPPSNGPGFPFKTVLAIVTFAALLYGYRRLADRGKGLNPAVWSEAWKVKLSRRPAPATPAQAPPGPLNGIQRPQQTGSAITPYLIDGSGALDPFFAALHTLELPPAPEETSPKVVTVLHYGDSPTTADLITGDVRALLQARFGDAGHGFLLTAKPWAWYQHRDVDIAGQGWQISTAVGKGREEVYGIGGASFQGGAGASSRITLKDAGQSRMEISCLAQAGGGTLSVAANGAPLDSFSTASEGAPHPAWHSVALPPATKTVELKPASGSVRLFGETFETGRRGVLYDSLGLNGASTSVLSNGFNAAAWTAELQHEAPTLVILNYGTNESGFGAYVDKQYEGTLRTAIARIRAALPNAAILVMSPMDRGKRSGVDEIQTYDTIPRIIAIQRRVAAELHCAFFDTFDAMGGDGTMARWYSGHPRLVAGDLIHPTPQGASIVAKLFVHDLSIGYDSYLRRTSQANAAAPAAQTPPRIPPPATQPNSVEPDQKQEDKRQ